MGKVLTILLVGFHFVGNAKDKLLLAMNIKDCVSCNAFIKNLESIDTNYTEVEFVFEEQYERDKDEIAGVYNFRNFVPKYRFNDSVYQAAILNGSSSFTFIYNGQNFYQNYIKNGLTPRVISNINVLNDKKFIYKGEDKYVPSTVYQIQQYKHEMFYVNPISNTVCKFSFIDDGPRRHEIVRFDKELIEYAYKKIMSRSALELERRLMSLNNLDLNLKITAFFKDKEDVLWVSTQHDMLYPSGNDTVLSYVEGVYKFDARYKLIDFYPFQVITDLNRWDLELNDADYAPAISRFTILDDTLITNLVMIDMQKNLPKYYLGKYVLNEQLVFELTSILNRTLSVNYEKQGYDYSNVKFSNNSNFYTMFLDDAIYSLHDHVPPIHLNLFSEKPKAMSDKKINNYMSAPLEFGKYIHFVYRANGDDFIGVYDLDSNKIKSQTDLRYYPQISKSNRWHYFDVANPNHYIHVNEDGFLERLLLK